MASIAVDAAVEPERSPTPGRTIGIGGRVLGSIALLLLLVGVGAGATGIALLWRLTNGGGDEIATASLIPAHDELQDTARGLLVVVGAQGGEAGLTAAESSWRRATQAMTGVCGAPGRPEHAAICARFVAAAPDLNQLLSERQPMSATALHATIVRLNELIGALRATNDRHHALVAEHGTRRDGQKLLLTVLAGVAAGGLLSGLALTGWMGATAATYRRRWLVAARAEQSAAETRAQLLETIEAIPVGFGLYGRDERLIMFNSRLADMNRTLYTADLIGQTHEQVVRRAASGLTRESMKGDSEDWIARQLMRFGDNTRGDTQTRGDGRWFEFYEIRTPSGLTASIRHDVTAHKLYQQELEASEKRYRDLVDSLADVVFTSDPDGRFTYVSAGVERMIGLTSAQFIDRTVASILHPDDHKRFGALLRASRAAPHETQSVVLRLGASPLVGTRYHELRFRPTAEVDAAGRVGFTGIARDVHDQVLMERRQRDDTMKLRSIVESAGALILLVDRDLKVVLANTTFLTATGDASRDVVGLPFEDVVVCSINKARLAAWLGHTGPERLAPIEFDNVLRAPDGGRRVVRVTASPVQDETGHVNYILFLGVDETVRRSAEVQLIDAARLATVGQMATGIAHEINQPLTVIGLSAESLIEEVADGMHLTDPQGFADDLQLRLKRIGDQTHRAANIVRQLRIFARKADEVASPFDVAQAIRGAADLMSEQFRLARFDVELDIAKDLPTVIGHPNRLQQVLINLITNARDAIEDRRVESKDARGRAWIGVRAWREPGEDLVAIEVADNGLGIPDDVLPHLFEPFFTTKPSGKGTGLGLSISSEIVREMNGTISVSNRPQGGAAFRMTLPTAST